MFHFLNPRNNLWTGTDRCRGSLNDMASPEALKPFALAYGLQGIGPGMIISKHPKYEGKFFKARDTSKIVHTRQATCLED